MGIDRGRFVSSLSPPGAYVSSYRDAIRLAGWDDKFIYVEQSMWRKGECTSHSLYRTALTDRNGIVPPEGVKEALGIEGAEPQLPEWVVAWAGAESLRPWPPMSPTPS